MSVNGVGRPITGRPNLRGIWEDRWVRGDTLPIIADRYGVSEATISRWTTKTGPYAAHQKRTPGHPCYEGPEEL